MVFVVVFAAPFLYDVLYSNLLQSLFYSGSVLTESKFHDRPEWIDPKYRTLTMNHANCIDKNHLNNTSNFPSADMSLALRFRHKYFDARCSRHKI